MLVKNIDVKSVKNLKTKSVHNVFFENTNMRFVAHEVFINGSKRWYPFFFRDSKIQPKYKNIKYIGSEDGRVPSVGFSTMPSTGFGFTSAQGVANFFKYIDGNTPGIISVVFTDNKTNYRSHILYLNFKDYTKIHTRAKSFSTSKKDEERTIIRSTLNAILPKSYKQPGRPSFFSGNVANFLDQYEPTTIKLSPEDADAMNSALLGSLSVEAVIATRKQTDKVYIEDVLEGYKELMKLKAGTKNLEERWQTFFKKHTWIFSQIFAFPAIYLGDKFNVGGRDISGGTDKIVDFLYKNELTNNIAFIEIKTHLAKVINDTIYRQPDIYAISKELGGAIVQVLDQRNKLQNNYHAKKGSSDIKSLNSVCLVIIGDTKMLKSQEQIDSFELYRSSNKEVMIVTFDELLKKITTMLNIFTTEDKDD